jgi:hypothetical protein
MQEEAHVELSAKYEDEKPHSTVENTVDYELWVVQRDMTDSCTVGNDCSNDVVSCESDSDLIGKVQYGGSVEGTTFDGCLKMFPAISELLEPNGCI